MNKYKFLAAFAALVFAMSLGLKGQDPPCCPPPEAINACYQSDPQCENKNAWTPAQESFELPEWPNCPITVHYCWRDCQNEGNHYEQLFICLTQYDCTDPECELYQWLNEIPELESQRLTELGNRTREYLIELKFWSFYNTLLPEQKLDYRCPTLFGGDIDWDNVRYKISYYIGSCSSICKGLRTIGDTEYLVTIEMICSPGFCCKVTTQFCIINGQLWMLTTKDDQDGAPACPGLTLPQCPEFEELYQTDCKSNCEPY
jgi:hypothetical protein